MANPTAPINTTLLIPGTDEGLQVPLASTAQTFQTGVMVGQNSGGYGTQLDDSAAMSFAGFYEGTTPLEVPSGGSNGDYKTKLTRPKRGLMKIASCAITDVHKNVFALYSDEVSFAPGISNFNYVGRVVRYISATIVEVEFEYNTPAPQVIVQLPYVATSVDRSHFVADKAYRVKRIGARIDVAGTDGGAVTAAVKKAASGTAIAAGTALHASTVNLKGTAATNATDPTLSSTSSDLDIAAGTCIGLDFTGTMDAAVGTIFVVLVPVIGK